MEAQQDVYIMHRNTDNINNGVHSIVDVIIPHRPDLLRAVYYYCCNKDAFLRAIALYWKRYSLNKPRTIYLDDYLKDLINITCSDVEECIQHRDDYETDDRFENLYNKRSIQYYSPVIQNLKSRVDILRRYMTKNI